MAKEEGAFESFTAGRIGEEKKAELCQYRHKYSSRPSRSIPNMTVNPLRRSVLAELDLRAELPVIEHICIICIDDRASILLLD
jgi:hypothetical protein